MSQRLSPTGKHPSPEEQIRRNDRIRQISQLVAVIEQENLNDALYSIFDGKASGVEESELDSLKKYGLISPNMGNTGEKYALSLVGEHVYLELCLIKSGIEFRKKLTVPPSIYF